MTPEEIAADEKSHNLPLIYQPTPWKGNMLVHSYGLGANPQMLAEAAPIEQLKKESTARNKRYGKSEVVLLLEQVERTERVAGRNGVSAEHDPTWGFFIFLTAYSERARQKLDAAMDNVIGMLRWNLRNRQAEPAYVAEAVKRLRMDVLEDRETLENASDERVKERFNEYIRDKYQFDNKKHPCPRLPARFLVCLVFDEATIHRLAALKFSEDAEDGYSALRGVTVKMIDRYWRCGKERSTRIARDETLYTGVDDCPIFALPYMYYVLTSNSYRGE